MNENAQRESAEREGWRKKADEASRGMDGGAVIEVDAAIAVVAVVAVGKLTTIAMEVKEDAVVPRRLRLLPV